MKRIMSLALLIILLSAAGVWAVALLDATKPTNNALFSTIPGLQREDRAKINEIIAAMPSTQDFTIVTGAKTAVNGDRLAVDTTSAAITITLPASPTAGNYVWLLDAKETWPTNNVTLARNGSNIKGAAANSTLSLSSYSVAVYVDASYGWEVLALYESGTLTKIIYPENYGGVGNGVADDTAAVLAAYTALGAGGGTIYFTNKSWKFNLSILKDNVKIQCEGHHWQNYHAFATGLFPYDNTKAVIEIGDGSHLVKHTIIDNCNIRGDAIYDLYEAMGASDGGTKGIHVHQAWDTTINNTFVSNFRSYNVKVGDVTNTLTDVQTVNFTNFGAATYGVDGATETNNMLFEQIVGVSATTDVHVNKFILFGPELGTGFQVKGVDFATWADGYFEIYQTGRGLQIVRNGSWPSFTDVVVEGSGGLTDVLIEQLSTLTPSDPRFIFGAPYYCLGYYKSSSGKLTNLYGDRAWFGNLPYLHLPEPVVWRAMQFVDDNWTNEDYPARYGTISSYPSGTRNLFTIAATGHVDSVGSYPSETDMWIRSDNGSISIQAIDEVDLTSSSNSVNIKARDGLVLSTTPTATHNISAIDTTAKDKVTFYSTMTGKMADHGVAAGVYIDGNTTYYLGQFFQRGTDVASSGILADVNAGVAIQAAAATGLPILARVTPTSTNTMPTIAEFRNQPIGGVGANDIGGTLEFTALNAAGTKIVVGYLQYKMSDTAAGTEDGNFTLYKIRAGSPVAVATW